MWAAFWGLVWLLAGIGSCVAAITAGVISLRSASGPRAGRRRTIAAGRHRRRRVDRPIGTAGPEITH